MSKARLTGIGTDLDNQIRQTARLTFEMSEPENLGFNPESSARGCEGS
jgi:hypothetical protein